MSRARLMLAVAMFGWLLEGFPSGSVRAQQAMPPSMAIEEANPINTAPVIISPRVLDMGQAVGPGFGAAGYDVFPPPYCPGVDAWSWQFLPEGLIYRSYLAGGREPRLSVQFVHARQQGWLVDPTIGTRVGLLRYGTQSPVWPEGWQFDAEAAVFPRVLWDHHMDVASIDFRFGFPLTWRRGPLESKFGYAHLSSHLGDEFMLANPAANRLNYIREALVWGIAAYPIPSARLYAEADYAVYVDGGAKPWHFQFGVDLSPAEPNQGFPRPFLAINSQLRQEVDFSGNLTVQAGAQWRSPTGRLLRLGLHYFNGSTDQAQSIRRFEEQIGAGFWYDF